ncbi:ABATE domain-containing protein, partial [Streptomyces kunmingensis]
MAAVLTGPSHPPLHELRFDSGRLCLDLVATAHPDERLASTDRLCAWLVGAGLVPDAAALPACTAAWLAAFRELRGHIGRLVRGELAGRPAPAA